jgi:hypothetical protein
MLDKSYYANGHLTQLAFLMLEAGVLTEEERELMLTHLSSCDECMERYVNSLTEDTLLEPPTTLEQDILSRISEQNIKQKQTKILAMQFVKLGIAVCITMVLFIGGIFDFITSVPQPKEETKPKVSQSKFVDFSNKMTDGFNQFAYHFNNSIKGENKNESK